MNLFLNRVGRKKGTYAYIIINAILNCALAVLISMKSMDHDTQQLLFAILRFLCGLASNVYSVAVVLGF